MKTILAIRNSGSKGKTETLREFAKLLLFTYPIHTPVFPNPASIPMKKDFRLVVQIGGKIIGVESQGDPKTNLKGRLIELSNIFNCDVILCSTRNRGDTTTAVKNLCRTKGYDDIWTSTYQVNSKAHHSYVNTLKARHLLELLIGLGII